MLIAVQEAIRDAQRDSRRSVVFPAPVNFDVPDISNKVASTEIYFNVLSELKENGFDVVMDLTKKSTDFHISWKPKRNDKKINDMIKFIAKHCVEAKESKPRKPKRRAPLKPKFEDLPDSVDMDDLASTSKAHARGSQRGEGRKNKFQLRQQGDAPPPKPEPEQKSKLEEPTPGDLLDIKDLLI